MSGYGCTGHSHGRRSARRYWLSLNIFDETLTFHCKITSKESLEHNGATYHIREVVADTPQVRLQRSQERRRGGGHFLES